VWGRDTRRPRGFWLVAGGLSAELLLEERFVESRPRYCFARRPPESPQSLNFLPSTETRIQAHFRTSPRSLCEPGSFLDLFVAVGVANAGPLPKCVRRNPRIINGLEIGANSHRASRRESVSRWNTAASTDKSAFPDNREFPLLASTDSLREPQAAAPPDFSFLASAPSRFR